MGRSQLFEDQALDQDFASEEELTTASGILRDYTTTISGVLQTQHDAHVGDSSIHFLEKDIDHGTISGTEDDDHLQYVPRDGSRGFTNTVSGVDPTEDYHLTTKYYVDSEIPHSSFIFSNTLTWNGTVDILGWYIQTDTARNLSSGSPIIMSKNCFHSHIVTDVINPSGLPFTITVSGTSISESTGIEIINDTENLNITSSGTYQTSKSWLDKPTFSIIESGKSCILDIYRTSYSDRSNTDFTVCGCRLEFIPDVSNWDLHLEIIKINNDGSYQHIDDVIFDNVDPIPRADDGEIGKYKRIYDPVVTLSGTQDEGLIVRMDQTGIRHFYLEVSLL